MRRRPARAATEHGTGERRLYRPAKKEVHPTEYFKDWLKTILYMNVLLLVCDSFIQKTKYESYLRFFSGFLMMLCLMKPLIDLAGAGQYMDASYIINQLKNEWQVIEQSEDLRGMKKDIQEEYDDTIQKQVTELAASFFIEVTEVRVRWETDGSAIKELDVEGKETGEEGETPQIHDLREALMEFYNLESSNIDITIRD